MVMQLRKVANHPYLVEGTEPPPDARGADRLAALRVAASGKLQLLDGLLMQLKERGHRVLVFSQVRNRPSPLTPSSMPHKRTLCNALSPNPACN